MPISYDTMRVGKKYYLTNHGERYEFIVMEKLAASNFLLKDIHTLEVYKLQELLSLGKGKDYDLYPLE